MPGCREEWGGGINHQPYVGLPLGKAGPARGRIMRAFSPALGWTLGRQALEALSWRWWGVGKLFLPLAVVNEDDNEKLCQHYSHFSILLGTCNLTPGSTHDGDSNCVLIDGVKK